MKKLSIAAVLLAAGVFGAGATALHAEISAERAGRTLEDVLIGEKGARLRVALVCEPRCEVVHFEDAVRLIGVKSDLKVDLKGRATLADGLTFLPFEKESWLVVDSVSPLELQAVGSCKTESGDAICIDYLSPVAAAFEQNGASAARTNTPQDSRGKLASEESSQASHAQPAPASENVDDASAIEMPVADVVAEATQSSPPALKEAPLTSPSGNVPFLGASIAPLREEPRIGLRTSAPERLSPPTPAASPTNDASEIDAAPTPELRSDAATTRDAIAAAVEERPSLQRPVIAKAAVQYDLRTEIKGILGRSVETGVCEGARAKLQADAWALDAMIDTAFCKAAAGELESADSDFQRLLAYTPDNYEALVGRALIAAEQDEKGMARKLFQDALDALPPIEESDRIVSAMQRL